MNVLLVEDDPTELKLLSAVLQSSGFHVLEKSSAEQAVEAIKASPPDVILLDLKLPGLQGLELARRLKADPATRSIPVIALTAVPEQFTRDEAMKAGCDTYIVKPVNIRALPTQVAAVAAEPASERT